MRTGLRSDAISNSTAFTHIVIRSIHPQTLPFAQAGDGVVNLGKAIFHEHQLLVERFEAIQLVRHGS